MAAKQVICDTDVMIDYWNKKSARHKATVRMIVDQIGIDNVALSAITQLELLAGLGRKQDFDNAVAKLKRFHIILLNELITEQAFTFFERYRLSHGLAIPDCLIAATAAKLDLPLLTFNKKDFQFIPEVSLYSTT